MSGALRPEPRLRARTQPPRPSRCDLERSGASNLSNSGPKPSAHLRAVPTTPTHAVETSSRISPRRSLPIGRGFQYGLPAASPPPDPVRPTHGDVAQGDGARMLFARSLRPLARWSKRTSRAPPGMRASAPRSSSSASERNPPSLPERLSPSVRMYSAPARRPPRSR